MRTLIAAAVACSMLVGLAHAQHVQALTKKTISIPAQELATALQSFAQEQKLYLIYAHGDVASHATMGVAGELTQDEALRELLKDTGLTFRYLDEKTVSILPVAGRQVGSANGLGPGASRATHLAQLDDSGNSDGEIAASKASLSDAKIDCSILESKTLPACKLEEVVGIPEVLVRGSRILNTDVQRSPDGIQAYVVLDREVIERSGAVNVEDLLRKQVTMITDSVTTSQLPGDPEGGRSRINLRGLGSDETLILIDGHRVAGVSNEGQAGQPDINGIPLAAVERIEILPMTASGIYGGGATGGVVNIVLRRDFKGLDAKLAYGNTFESDVATRRVDISAGMNFKDGKSTVLVTGSYADGNSLLVRERSLVHRGREHILANNPDSYFSGRQPPLGATPNIASVTGENLLLKDGTPLGRSFTFVPDGYVGTLSDGGLALAHNAGKYNLDLPNTAQNDGLARGLLSVPKTTSVLASARHEFSPRVRGFLDAGVQSLDSQFPISRANTFANADVVISANAPNNPFQQDIYVSVPAVGADGATESKFESLRSVAGILVDVTPGLHVGLDFTWSQSQYSYEQPGGVTEATRESISNGSLDVLRDLNYFPVALELTESPAFALSPAKATLKDANIRSSATLPWSLPGGKPVLTGLLQHRKEFFDDSFQITYPNSYLIPSRSQSASSAYLELQLPIVSGRNDVPGIHRLDFQLAGRRERFRVTGADFRIDLAHPQPITRRTTTQASTDPTFGVRYQPIPDAVLRASYGTGYLPPSVSQLVPSAPLELPFGIFGLTDPLRGNERLGTATLFQGGNPALRPEDSESSSIGLVLTPRWVPSLRVSADWLMLEKRDNIVAPNVFSQPALNALLAAAPERIIRDRPSDGYGAGPIVSIDATLMNIAKLKTETLDLALNYDLEMHKMGALSIAAGATRIFRLETQLAPNTPIIENVGVSRSGSLAGNEGGGLKWRATGTVVWNYSQMSLGWRTNYFDSYFLNTDHSVIPNQGSATIPSQMYHDIFGSYVFGSGTGALFDVLTDLEVQWGIKNVFGKEPPVDVTSYVGLYYSAWGDPNLSTYYITVRKSFGGSNDR